MRILSYINYIIVYAHTDYHGISSFSPSTWHCSSTFPVFGGDRRHVSLVLIVSTSTRPPAGQPQRSGPGRCKDDDRLN